MLDLHPLIADNRGAGEFPGSGFSEVSGRCLRTETLTKELQGRSATLMNVRKASTQLVIGDSEMILGKRRLAMETQRKYGRDSV